MSKTLSGANLFLVLATFVGLVGGSAQAELRHQYTFNDGTAQDSTGNANGSIGGNGSIDLGVLNLPGGTADFVTLPASTIDISSYTDATFEAWFSHHGGAPWQRLFDFGRTNVSGSGRDYIFYSPSSGFGDNRAAITDNAGGEENLAIGGPSLAINTSYHVAVVVDDNSNGGSNRLSIYLNGALAGFANLIHSLSDVSNSLAYIGNSLYTPDASFDGQIDEFRIYNHAFDLAEVIGSRDAGPIPLDLLGLDVNTVTGQVTLTNRYSTPLKFDYYRIESGNSSINAADWDSLDQQNIDAIGTDEGESWDVFGTPNSSLVAESFVLDATTVAPGATLDLGHTFDPSVAGLGEQGELNFRFALQGSDLRTGIVNYVTPEPLDGDYNDDGQVDAADYTVWRNALGTALLTADGDGDGTIDADDYKIWKFTYGNVQESGTGGLATAVPEPSAITVVVVASLVGALFKRTGR